MNTYVKIKDGKTSVSCNVFEWPLVVERIAADECPEGFKLRVKANEKPDVPQGKWLAFRFDDVGESITKTYFLVNEGESAIRQATTYSKYKIVCKLMELKIWENVKQLMISTGLQDLWDAAQEFKSDDKHFQEGVEYFKTEFGATDERVAEILKDCIKD